MTSLVPATFFVAGQIRAHQSLRVNILMVLFLTTAGSGLMLNTLRAAIEIFTKKQAEFERTAKFGSNMQAQKQKWMLQNYNLTADSLTFWELLLATCSIATSFAAGWLDHWGVAFYAAIFSVGLYFLSGLTLIQTAKIRLNRWQTRHVTQSDELAQEVPLPSGD